jgi:hypothetical protein
MNSLPGSRGFTLPFPLSGATLGGTASLRDITTMRLAALIAATALVVIGTAAAEAQARKENIVRVKPRSFLDAGTTVLPGTYSNYSLGQTPYRASESIGGWGGSASRLLPDRHNGWRPITVDIQAPAGLRR